MLNLHRRGLLAALLLTFAAALPAQQAVDLGQGTTLLPGRLAGESAADGNSVLLIAPDGLVVFDAGRSTAHTQHILDRIAAAAPAQLILVNSHWHLDHAGGLDALRKAYPDAILYANDAAIRNVGTRSLSSYRERLVASLKNVDEPVPEDASARAELALIGGSIAFYPTNNVPRPRDLELAGRPLHIGLGRAISGGDVWLRDDANQLLIAGDLVTLPAPLLEGACAQVWLDDLNILWAQDFERLVPGHGPVMSRKDFRTWQLAFEDLVQCAASRKSDESCRDGWIKGTRKLLDADQRAQATRILDRDIPALLRNADVQSAACSGR